MVDAKTGIIGLLAVLLVSGGIISLTGQNHIYYCKITDQIGVFNGGLTKSNLTAYPDVYGVSGKRCTGGWTSYTIQNIPNNVTKYLCDTEKCTIIW